MYYKENDATDTKMIPAHHEGKGIFKTKGFFDNTSRLPIKFQMWELDPGSSEGDHTHDGDSSLEEIYYFIEGKGSMWADNEEFSVTAGDAVMIPPGSDHGFKNTGSTPLKLIIIWGKPESL